jgi:hypothetical protein
MKIPTVVGKKDYRTISVPLQISKIHAQSNSVQQNPSPRSQVRKPAGLMAPEGSFPLSQQSPLVPPKIHFRIIFQSTSRFSLSLKFLQQ